MSLPFQHDFALACSGVPDSLISSLSLNEREPVNLERAWEHHACYLSALAKSGLNLVLIEPNEAFPGCVFVEDTAVALGNRILITNLIASTRRAELDAVRCKFNSLKAKLDLEIGEVQNREEAFIEGGDVLYTGREFLVGLTTRTNQKGCDELTRFFKDIPLNCVCVPANNLHLTSCMTILDEDVILYRRTTGRDLCRQINWLCIMKIF